MPIAKVQMPDGRIARFEVAEGTTPEEVTAFAATMQMPEAAPAQEPQKNIRERIAEASPALSSFVRGVADIPRGVTQFAGMLAAPYSGVPAEQLESGLRKSEVGEAVLGAGAAYPAEKKAAEEHGVQDFLGTAATGFLLPSMNVAKGAPLAAKAAASAMSGVAGSQMAGYDSIEDRLAAGGTGALFGGGLPVVQKGLAAAGKPLAKYVPFTDKSKAAAQELLEVRGNPSVASEKAVYNKNVELFGKEDADKFSWYEMTGDAGVKNKASAYARAQTPEGIAQIKEAANARAAAIENKLSSYSNIMRLSKRETDYLDTLHKEVLPKTNVDTSSYLEITSDPAVRNFINRYAKPPKNADAATAESAMLFQAEVAGMHPHSAAYLDAVRKRLQDMRYATGTSASDARHYKAAVEKLDKALNKATDGRYQAMKSLQQREMFTRNLDEEFAAVTKTLREGQSVPDLKDIKKIFRGKNFQELSQEAARLKNGPRRVQAERALQLIQHFVKDADPDSVVSQIGRGAEERTRFGTNRVVEDVGTFMRGGYNKEMAYLIDHPEKYIKALEEIEKEAAKNSYIPRIATLLGRIQTEDIGAEEK